MKATTRSNALLKGSWLSVKQREEYSKKIVKQRTKIYDFEIK